MQEKIRISRLKIRWRTATIFSCGLAALATIFVVSLAMPSHWPQSPDLIRQHFFTLTMPEPPHQRRPTVKQILSWIKAISAAPAPLPPAPERLLVAAGDLAIPALRHALAGLTTTATRHRLNQVLAAIIQADALRGPLINLKLKHSNLQTVFTRLCVPVGIVPDFYPMWQSGAPPPAYFTHTFLTLTVHHQPFWQVLRQIARITGVSATAQGFAGPSLHIGGQPPMAPGVFARGTPVDIRGAFVIALQWPWTPPYFRAQTLPTMAPSHQIIRRHRISRPAMAAPTTLGLGVNVLWCPAGNRLTEFGPLQITQVRDNTGKSLLLPAKPEVPRRANWGSYPIASGQMIVFNCYERLKRPTPHATMLSILRGTFPVVLWLGPHHYQVKNLTSGKAQLYYHGLIMEFRKPVPVTGTSATISPKCMRWRVRLVLNAAGMSPRQVTRLGDLVRQLERTDAVSFDNSAGKSLGAYQAGDYYGAKWNGYYDFYITSQHAPRTAWLTLYNRIGVKVAVPFAFKNVPLPRSTRH